MNAAPHFPHEPIARQHAREFRLPLDLVLAIIQVESAGDPEATRFEPHYRWLWDVAGNAPFRLSAAEAKAKQPPRSFPAHRGTTPATEFIQQQTSFGLMQVMGAVARELGMARPLVALCETTTGIEYGCRQLRRLADRFYERDGYGWAGVVRAYNTGHPRCSKAGDAYLEKVQAAGFDPERPAAIGAGGVRA